MKIDFKRLQSDVERRKLARVSSSHGRAKTGATAVIREVLTELERMHAEGATWTEIAEALSAQGVTQGNNKPLTGRRLTALIHNIKIQEKTLLGPPKLADGEGAKTVPPSRSPRLTRRQDARPAKQSLTLSADLNEIRPVKQPRMDGFDEEQLRRNEFNRHAHLLKKR
ncbi:hypothetical protein [Bradyrhizobium liaoningense]|uniref:hypothetical protein n=1 Tax=Bradyrhizobium liaoningense TaxID=43992 RepID=UPI001BAE02EB|nr:hypothetical protein [Bradyrhizobium liaoningense]MBR1030324.1 hypothetical protein [Bradyrhizobium liaoningense]